MSDILPTPCIVYQVMVRPSVHCAGWGWGLVVGGVLCFWCQPSPCSCQLLDIWRLHLRCRSLSASCVLSPCRWSASSVAPSGLSSLSRYMGSPQMSHGVPSTWLYLRRSRCFLWASPYPRSVALRVLGMVVHRLLGMRKPHTVLEVVWGSGAKRIECISSTGCPLMQCSTYQTCGHEKTPRPLGEVWGQVSLHA